MTSTRRLTTIGWSLVAGAIALYTGAHGWIRWTNSVAERRAEAERRELLATWAAPAPSGAIATEMLVPGEGFALLSIPRLRDQVWNIPVLHGVGDDELRSGIGHYPDSARPGEYGNFALAGHRTAHGEPFADFDELRVGDEVIVRTPANRYVYTLVRDAVVEPEEVWVVSPRAAQTVGAVGEPLITLVTCTPKWSTSQRWVWWGVLRSSSERALPRR